MNHANWSLPTQAEIGGQVYSINTDYRDILEIIWYIQNEPEQQAALYIALALFYETYDDMPPEDCQEAINYLFSFIGCFEEADDKPHPKNFDWEQDYNAIAADINKAAGGEVRAMADLHWFTFIGFFTSIGEGQLSTLVSIRKKLRERKKLEKWEQEYYKENKAKVDFKKINTPEEQAEIDRLNKLLDGR